MKKLIFTLSFILVLLTGHVQVSADPSGGGVVPESCKVCTVKEKM